MFIALINSCESKSKAHWCENIKVKNIKEIFEKENIEIDYENSRGYSDSYKDDKYMLSLVEKKFLIN